MCGAWCGAGSGSKRIILAGSRYCACEVFAGMGGGLASSAGTLGSAREQTDMRARSIVPQVHLAVGFEELTWLFDGEKMFSDEGDSTDPKRKQPITE